MGQSSAIAAPPATNAATRRSMQSNRRADTKPEVLLRSLLHRAGLRFRKDKYIKLEPRGVKVDVVFSKARVAVFMDGCFWHRCPEHGTMPTRNHEYWRAKFQRNIERDQRTNKELRRLGWTVLRVWEHEVVDSDLADHAVSQIKEIVTSNTRLESANEPH